MWTSPPCDHPLSRADKARDAESLPSSHAGVHRGGNTTGLCVTCAGRLLGRLRLLLHGARDNGAYHRQRRFKLETCNVAAARRRLFLLLASRPRLSMPVYAAHPPSPCTACLPWAKGGLGRTLLRIDSIGTKLRECVLLSPLGSRALPFTDCFPHQSLPLLGLCREEQGQHDASDLPLAHPSTLPFHYALDDTPVSTLLFVQQEFCAATLRNPPPQKGRSVPSPIFPRA
ncbi:hypothetical protein V2W45_1488251 [Cenococcum geophilum]